MKSTTIRIDTDTKAKLAKLAGEKPIVRYLRDTINSLSGTIPSPIENRLDEIKSLLVKQEPVLTYQERLNNFMAKVKDIPAKERRNFLSNSPEYKALREEGKRNIENEHITPEQVVREVIYKFLSNATPEEISEWKKRVEAIKSDDFIHIPRNMPVSEAVKLIKKELTNED